MTAALNDLILELHIVVDKLSQQPLSGMITTATFQKLTSTQQSLISRWHAYTLPHLRKLLPTIDHSSPLSPINGMQDLSETARSASVKSHVTLYLDSVKYDITPTIKQYKV
jgi:hypothetical protein